MMRPTARDLAEAAGVSLATVDRVLNGRPNVSPKAARKVQDAIDRIGFERNPAAMVLARSKVYHFRFVLPTKGDQYLTELLARVEETRLTARTDLMEVAVDQVPADDPYRLARHLTSLEPDMVDGFAVMATE